MRRDIVESILFVVFVGLSIYLIAAIFHLISLMRFLMYLLPNSLLYLAIGCLASIFFVFIILRKVKIKSAFRIIFGFILILTLFWLISQTILAISLETEYSNVKMHYFAEYRELRNETSKLDTIWHIVSEYRKEFDTSTYGNPNAIILNRVVYVAFNPILAPLLGFYFIEYDGFNKLIVVQKKGNCAEFAEAVSFLLSDTTGLPTRVISFEGIDHAFPEINIKGEWWVLDKTYTTPKHPVEASQYHEVLKTKRLDKYVANLVEKGSSRSVLSEHGFKPVNITIVAIVDRTTNISDDSPVAGAEVEIFAPANHYDPLVAKGKTDENGKLSVVLKSQKDYVIVAKIEKLGKRAIGVIIVDSSELEGPNKTVEVYLHKYE